MSCKGDECKRLTLEQADSDWEHACQCAQLENHKIIPNKCMTMGDSNPMKKASASDFVNSGCDLGSRIDITTALISKDMQRKINNNNNGERQEADTTRLTLFVEERCRRGEGVET